MLSTTWTLSLEAVCIMVRAQDSVRQVWVQILLVLPLTSYESHLALRKLLPLCKMGIIFSTCEAVGWVKGENLCKVLSPS